MNQNNQYQSLQSANPAKIRSKFLAYCDERVKRVESGEVEMTRACYDIAGTMFISNVEQDDDLLSIATLAGELELPDHHLSEPREKLWADLKNQLDDLRSALPK